MSEISGLGGFQKFQRVAEHPLKIVQQFESGESLKTGLPPPHTDIDIPQAKSRGFHSTISIPTDYENKNNQRILEFIKELFGPLIAFIKEHPWLTLAFVAGVILILASFPVLGGAIAGVAGISIIGVHLALTIPYGVMIYTFGVALINVARGGALQKKHEMQIEFQERKMQKSLSRADREIQATITREQHDLDQIHEANLKRERKLDAEKKKLEVQIAESQTMHEKVQRKRSEMELTFVRENLSHLPSETQTQAQRALSGKSEEIIDGIQILGVAENLPLFAQSLTDTIKIPDFTSQTQKANSEVRNNSRDLLSAIGTFIKEHKLAIAIMIPGLIVAIVAYPLFGAVGLFAVAAFGIYAVWILVEGGTMVSNNLAQKKLEKLTEEFQVQIATLEKQLKKKKDTEIKITRFVANIKTQEAQIIERKEEQVRDLRAKTRTDLLLEEVSQLESQIGEFFFPGQGPFKSIVDDAQQGARLSGKALEEIQTLHDNIKEIQTFQPPQIKTIYDDIDDIEKFAENQQIGSLHTPLGYSALKAESQMVNNKAITIPDIHENKGNQLLFDKIKGAFRSLRDFVREHPWLTIAFVGGTLLILVSFPVLGFSIAGLTGLSIVGVSVGLTLPYGVMIYYYGVVLLNKAHGGSIKKEYERQIESQEKSMQELLESPADKLRATVEREQKNIEQIHQETLRRTKELEGEKRKVENEIETLTQSLNLAHSARIQTEKEIDQATFPQLSPDDQIKAHRQLVLKSEEMTYGMQILEEISEFPPFIPIEITLPTFPSPTQTINLPMKKKILGHLDDFFQAIRPSALGTFIMEHKLPILVIISGIIVAAVAFPLLGPVSIIAVIGFAIYGLWICYEGGTAIKHSIAQKKLAELEREYQEEASLLKRQFEEKATTEQQIVEYVSSYQAKHVHLLEEQEKRIGELREEKANLLLQDAALLVQACDKLFPEVGPPFSQETVKFLLHNASTCAEFTGASMIQG